MDYINDQLSNVNYKRHFWVNPEIDELANILMPSEEIVECVSGTYEGGSALLVVTNERLLLIDKKALQFLTIEDMRFDKINQIDYSYRLLAAYLNINSGLKNLKFSSMNKARLRKLVNYIQVFISESKNNESKQIHQQSKHLEGINERLSTYLESQDDKLTKLNDKLLVQEPVENSEIVQNKSINSTPDFQLAEMAKREILSAKNFIQNKSNIFIDRQKKINASYFIGKIIFSNQNQTIF